MYSPKLAACDIAPHFKDPNRCGICGSILPQHCDTSGFCGDDCARVFFVNHNWDLARRAAAHHADYTCQRCGHHADTRNDPMAHTRELVVRHRQRPQSGNYRSRGCHQHLANLITLCRSCDTASPRTIHIDVVSHHNTAATPFDSDDTEDNPPTAGTRSRYGAWALTSTVDPNELARYGAWALTSTVDPNELARGMCHPSQGHDPEFWFRQRQSAIKVCEQCPVRARCAQLALELRVTDGVYAGISLPGNKKTRELRAARGRLQELLDDTHSAQDTAATTEIPYVTARLERVGA
ncbi:hypothetical protein AWC17_03290 [Mycobacterium nebraskense]|uniref:4Fe-4S Wbl-type domain-containing protein n=1 Tax=Mycobacterium nebraskense TaxID=244292 RepID=A0A1X1ZMJ9_9MYCO|nr:hypothetical protein AWC17_03290 [Mycobacterium nebraskense]